jgi:hypothetical protein
MHFLTLLSLSYITLLSVVLTPTLAFPTNPSIGSAGATSSVTPVEEPAPQSSLSLTPDDSQAPAGNITERNYGMYMPYIRLKYCRQMGYRDCYTRFPEFMYCHALSGPNHDNM